MSWELRHVCSEFRSSHGSVQPGDIIGHNEPHMIKTRSRRQGLQLVIFLKWTSSSNLLSASVNMVCGGLSWHWLLHLISVSVIFRVSYSIIALIICGATIFFTISPLNIFIYFFVVLKIKRGAHRYWVVTCDVCFLCFSLWLTPVSPFPVLPLPFIFLHTLRWFTWVRH